LITCLEKTVLSEKMIEEDLSRVKESAIKSTYKLILALRGVRTRVKRVLPCLSLAPPTTKRKKQSNPPKPTIHPIQSHPSTTKMSFASGVRGLRGGALSILETHIMSSLIFHLVLTLVPCLTLLLMLCLISLMDSHCSNGFGSRENHFVPRRFGYGPRPHHGGHTPRRPGFPARGSHI
jgi:hypothetical protein